MKILTIPLLVHDASICILEDGAITSYLMEERFSRNKHDAGFDNILDSLKDNHFDKIIIIQHFLENYVYPLELLKKKIQNLSYDELIVGTEKHHVYHAFSGFYNSGFDESICFSIDGSGAILNNGDIEIESIYHLRKNQQEIQLYQRTREFGVAEADVYGNFWDFITAIDEKQLSVGEKFCKYSMKFG